jgi:hypothetical protein
MSNLNNSIGPVRNLTMKFIDYKRYQKEPTKLLSLNDSGSILNDKGKIK